MKTFINNSTDQREISDDWGIETPYKDGEDFYKEFHRDAQFWMAYSRLFCMKEI